VERIPGVGPVTQGRLQGLGVRTIGQLAALAQQDLVHHFGKHGLRFYQLARGQDHEPVTPESEPKQLSQESTFPADVYSPEEMHDALRQLADELSGRLRRRQLKGRVVTLKVRYPDFQTITRSQSLPFFVDQPGPLLEQALQLLSRTEAPARGVRLLGLGLSGFAEERPEQLDLFAGAAVDRSSDGDGPPARQST
jgi:DNA polymerase-4